MRMYIGKQSFEIFSFLLAALLPIVFTCLWLATNNELPAADATDYLGVALKNYRHYTQQGFWDNILHFEIIRGWRPIFFSVLGIPFLFLSKGNVFFTYHAVTLLCIIISAIYIYLFLQLKLDRLSSIIGANLICLLPFVQTQLLVFFAESAFFPCLFACLYHLIKSDYFRNKLHTIAFIFFLTLATVLRPVESAIHLSFVFLLFFSIGCYKNLFSPRQVLIVAALCLSFLFLFCIISAAHFIDHSPFKVIDGGFYDKLFSKKLYQLLIQTLVGVTFIWGLIAGIDYYAAKQKIEKWNGANQLPVVSVFFIFLTLTFLWFLPQIFKTFLWIYRTSIGDLAVITESLNPILPIRDAILFFIKGEGQLIIAGLIMAAMIGILCMRKNERRSIIFSMPVIYLLLLMPIPVWIALNTFQTSSRKLSIALPAMLMVLLILGLQRGYFWWLRISLVIMLVALQFTQALGFIYPNYLQVSILKNMTGDYPVPVTLQPSPYTLIENFLSEQYERYGFKKIGIVVDLEKALPIDFFLFDFKSKISNQPYITVPHIYSAYSPQNLEEMKIDDAILILDKANEMIVSTAAANAYAKKFSAEKNPTLKTQQQLLTYFSQAKLSSLGWTMGPCIIVKAKDQNDYRGCLLLPIKKSEYNLWNLGS